MSFDVVKENRRIEEIGHDMCEADMSLLRQKYLRI